MGTVKIILADLVRFAALAALIIWISSGFGGSDKVYAAAFENVSAEVIAAAGLEGEGAPALPGDNQMIRRLYDLEPSEFEGILLYYPASNMNAEELLLVKLGSDPQALAEQQEKVADAIAARIDTQMHTFEGYAPQQYAMLEKAVTDVEGNYILFVSGENAEQVRAVFEESIAR